MYRIIDNRSSGKTSRFLLLAKENNGVVVCANPYAMREKAYGYGLTGIDFISYKNYLDGMCPKDRVYFIDEIENFVQSIGGNMIGYSLSNED